MNKLMAVTDSEKIKSQLAEVLPKHNLMHFEDNVDYNIRFLFLKATVQISLHKIIEQYHRFLLQTFVVRKLANFTKNTTRFKNIAVAASLIDVWNSYKMHLFFSIV